MDEENVLDFNFWPSYADLMLSFVLILLLVLFLVTVFITQGTVNLSHIEEKQKEVIKTIVSSYGGKQKQSNDKSFEIYTKDPERYDIKIYNDLKLQRITFADHVLFESDQYQLKETGKAILRSVGDALKKQISNIERIQIEGHADTDNSRRFRSFGEDSNTVLAAMRAIEVFRFLRDDVDIDPSKKLMSATSFGKYKPVQRDDPSYLPENLPQYNSTEKEKAQNRRIELLLFYESEKTDSIP